MRQYLIASGKCGKVLVEWDEMEGVLRIDIPATAESRAQKYICEDVVIKRGVLGMDTYAWEGRALYVTTIVHEHLKREFPTADLYGEYIMADKWLVTKKRELKNIQQFLVNWLKKTRGGNQNANGVVL